MSVTGPGEYRINGMIFFVLQVWLEEKLCSE